MEALVVRSERVVLPEGERAATIHIHDGRVIQISSHSDVPAGVPMLDAGTLVVMPGLVDTHVHINEPGRADWEGFRTATRAAAAGGVTTVVDMPLNSIPATTTAEGFDMKLQAAAGQCHVDVGFWGGVIPGNVPELDSLVRSGALGFKAFLAPSGVDEFPCVSEADLREALPVLAALERPLLVHAELPAALLPINSGSDPRAYATWLNSRPVESELEAIELLIRLTRQYGNELHIVHLAAPQALPMLRAARREGLRITVETCPHYLSFCSEQIADGHTEFKCAPPIREREHQEGLWQALMSGELDLVATDHSPAPPALKHLDDGDFTVAWGGIASLQLGLGAVWSGAAKRGATPWQLSRWLARAPAALAGLGTKGRITAGTDADLVIWDPDAETTVDATRLEHRHPVTPYHGSRLRGRVQKTMLRGEIIYDDGSIVGAPRGRPILARTATISLS